MTGTASAGTVLSARGVTVRFGGVTALSGVDIDVPATSITGLIGPNGAGKSTLLGVLSGFIKPQEGTVAFVADDVTHASPQQRARRGLARTFQHPELFAELNVRDHLVLAYRVRRERRRLFSDLYTGRGLAKPSAAERERVDSLIELLDIQELATRPILSLSFGACRLMEVGRALASWPTVILADEPFSGLDRGETERLAAVFSRVVEVEGVAFLLVEHDVDAVLSLSTTVNVLDFGQKIATGTSEEIRADPRVRAAYLGDYDPSETGRSRSKSAADVRIPPVAEGGAAHEVDSPRAEERPLLEVRNLRVFYGQAQALDDVSLDVAEGSALAVLGLNGAGKSTLSRVLSGLVPAREGRIEFGGAETTRQAAHAIRRMGLAYLPEGRGIFPGLSVGDNLKMGVQTLGRADRDDAIERAVRYFPVLGGRVNQLAASLSGGEQQMLSLARALALEPRLVIADEVALGLAPLVVDAVYEALERAREDGISLIIIDQFVQRALGMCDHAMILRRGTVAWQGPSADAAEGVLEHYLGAEAGAVA